jgi:S-DNA-T family DNA segregation ATPase FtsK/SpoIIIE
MANNKKNNVVDQPAHGLAVLSADTLEYTSRLIEHKLKDFGVEIKVVAVYPEPVITRYEIEPATGVKFSQITKLTNDLSRALSVASIRVVDAIPRKTYMVLEKTYMAIEIPNRTELPPAKAGGIAKL